MDCTIIACGELVVEAKKAAASLAASGIFVRVLDMYSLKPLDEDAVLTAAKETKAIVTVEEHARQGGLGSLVAQVLAEKQPTRLKSLTLPDAPVVTGKSADIFRHYGLDAAGIEKAVRELI